MGFSRLLAGGLSGLLLASAASAADQASSDELIKKMAADLAKLANTPADIEAKDAQQQWDTAGLWDTTTPQLRVITPTSELKEDPKPTAPTLAVAKMGEVFPVVGKTAEYYGVLNSDKSVSWVPTKAVAPVTDTAEQWYIWNTKNPYVWSTQIAAPQGTAPPARSPGFVERVKQETIQALMQGAQNFKDTYNNNSLMKVTGFDLTLIPPSVNMHFEFK